MAEPQVFGSDRMVEAMVDLGIEHISLNPGASTRGLHDSLTQTVVQGPQPVLCLHEEIAVGIAHGYAKALGRPMGVLVHDTVGLLHASMALFNAWLDRAPMLVLVGTGPLDATQRRPWIDWVHTPVNQTELVRQYVVWADQPASIDAAVASLRRAWREAIRMGGPGVVSVDIKLQEQRITVGPRMSAPGGLRRISRPAPDPDLVEMVISRLARAQRPIFVTDRPISNRAGAALVTLAERVGALVCDVGGGAAFPAGHPYDATEAAAQAIEASDLQLLIDVRDPGLAATAAQNVVLIGPGNPRSTVWLSSGALLETALQVDADVALTLEALRDAWGRKPRPVTPELLALAQQPAPAWMPPTLWLDEASLAHAVADATREHHPVVAYGSLHGWSRRAFRFHSPDEYLGESGGAGLGYGPAAIVGAALALRGAGRLVLGIVGDGELLYVPQAVWTAAHEGLPLLLIVNANRSYGQDLLHQESVARARDRSAQRAAESVAIASPSVDMAGLARALGVGVEGPVSRLDELRLALTRAVQRVLQGEPVLVEVITRTRSG